MTDNMKIVFLDGCNIDIDNKWIYLHQDSELYNKLVDDGFICKSEADDNALLESCRKEIQEPYVSTAYFFLTKNCNLACKYCFAEEGEYHGRRALMTEEVGKRALEFLVENSGSRKNLEVDFFGGEPLMNFAQGTQSYDS